MVDLEELFQEAFAAFLEAERDHLLTNVSERNSCGRLAIWLHNAKEKRALAPYVVDVEYDRAEGGELKKIVNSREEVINIVCDIILHSRGHADPDNLIAIEMKKSYRPQREKQKDRERLMALTMSEEQSYSNAIYSKDGRAQPGIVCGYALGYFIEIDIQNERCLVEKYRAGECAEKFAAQL